MSLSLTGEQLLNDLEARGLIHDSTDRGALVERLNKGPIGVYVGSDPTADSLHAGNLLGQVMLRRFQLAGHRPVVLAGGATGMVGDPGGRSEERNLLDRATLNHNVACVKKQLEKILDFDGTAAARMVDNATWTEPMGTLEFLRDVGKHFTVNQMVAKESVRARMESENGISFTEFSTCFYKPMISGIYASLKMLKCKWAVPISGATSLRAPISFGVA